MPSALPLGDPAPLDGRLPDEVAIHAARNSTTVATRLKKMRMPMIGPKIFAVAELNRVGST